MNYVAINPTTGEELRSYPTLTPAELKRTLQRSEEAFGAWRNSPFVERSSILRAVARRLRADASEHGILMAEEMGKPVTAGKSEAEKCAWVCEYYADNAERFLADEEALSDARRSYVAYRPLACPTTLLPIKGVAPSTS